MLTDVKKVDKVILSSFLVDKRGERRKEKGERRKEKGETIRMVSCTLYSNIANSLTASQPYNLPSETTS